MLLRRIRSKPLSDLLILGLRLNSSLIHSRGLVCGANEGWIVDPHAREKIDDATCLSIASLIVAVGPESSGGVDAASTAQETGGAVGSMNQSGV